MHDRRIGAVAQEEGGQFASFQYDDAFLRSGMEVAPIHLPLSGQPYRFENLGRASFHGLLSAITQPSLLLITEIP